MTIYRIMSQKDEKEFSDVAARTATIMGAGIVNFLLVGWWLVRTWRILIRPLAARRSIVLTLSPCQKEEWLRRPKWVVNKAVVGVDEVLIG